VPTCFGFASASMLRSVMAAHLTSPMVFLFCRLCRAKQQKRMMKHGTMSIMAAKQSSAVPAYTMPSSRSG
jgi:hypothetical protein